MKNALISLALLTSLMATLCLFNACKKDPNENFPSEELIKKTLVYMQERHRDTIDSIMRISRLLPTIAPIEPAQQVGPTQESWASDNLRCKTVKYQWAPGNPEYLLSDPTSDVIYPGGFIRLETIMSGAYTPIILPRRPIVISISSPFIKGSPTDTIYDPSKLSMAREAINRLFKIGVDGTLAAASTRDEKRIYSESQASLFVGANFQGYGAKVSASFDWSNKKIRTRYMIKFYQKFFTVNVDLPQKPSDLIKGIPDLAMLNSYSPVYVSNVSYGRVVMLLIESEKEESEIKASFNAAYSSFSVSAGVNVAANFKKLMEVSSLKVFALGGNASAAASINSPESLEKFIKESATFSKESVPVPISYSLRFLKNNEIAKIVQMSEYSVQECDLIPDMPYEYALPGVLETGEIKGDNIEQKLGPVDLVKGDKEYGGRCFITAKAKLFTVNDREVWVNVNVLFEEQKEDRTTGQTNKDIKLFTIPEGYKITQINSDNESFWAFRDKSSPNFNTEDENDLVKQWVINGDTDGDDLPGKYVGEDRSWIRVFLNKITVSMRKINP